MPASYRTGASPGRACSRSRGRLQGVRTQVRRGPLRQVWGRGPRQVRHGFPKRSPASLSVRRGGRLRNRESGREHRIGPEAEARKLAPDAGANSGREPGEGLPEKIGRGLETSGRSGRYGRRSTSAVSSVRRSAPVRLCRKEICTETDAKQGEMGRGRANGQMGTERQSGARTIRGGRKTNHHGYHFGILCCLGVAPRPEVLRPRIAPGVLFSVIVDRRIRAP